MPRANLIFKDTKALQEIIDHAKESKEWSMGYDADMEPAPALFLVGDEGIYLMSNGKPGCPRNEEAAELQKRAAEKEKKGEKLTSDERFIKQKCVFAYGCDPEKDEDYYENKRRLFGGDDGAITLSVSAFEPLSGFRGLHITPKAVSVIRND